MSLEFDLYGPSIPLVSPGSITDFEGVREALRPLRMHVRGCFWSARSIAQGTTFSGSQGHPRDHTAHVIREREYRLRQDKPRKDKRMDEIVKRLSDLSSRLSSRLSSVGRVRLVVGLVVALFFAWLVSPVFHGLVMALYVSWPFLLVVLVGTVFGAYLWRVGDKDPAKVVAVVAIVAGPGPPHRGSPPGGPQSPRSRAGRG